MLVCLKEWRSTVFPTVFGHSSMCGAAALISDQELERVSRCAPIPSPEQLRRVLIKWSRVDSLLDSLWSTLHDSGFTLPPLPEPSDLALPEASDTPAPSAPVRTRKARAPPKPKPKPIPSGSAESSTVAHPPPTPSDPAPKR